MPDRTVAAGAAAAVLLASLLAVAARPAADWLSRPADVPDHRVGLGGTIALRLDGAATVGQSLLAHHNHLSRVEVVIGLPEGTGNRPRRGVLVFRLRELDAPGSTPDLRRVEVPAAAVPAGQAFDHAPGRPGERWVSFVFDPVPLSGQRPFLFILEYPNAPPEERVDVLAIFYNPYRYGSLYQNGDFQPAGSLTFRTYFRGVEADRLRAVRDHVLATQPLLRGSRLFFGVLGGLYLGLSALLVWVLVRRTVT